MMRAGMILTGGNVAASLLNFARNILVARLISVENFGIAATFLVTVAVLQAISSMSIDRMLVQARDGDDPKLIDALHGFALARGAVIAALLFLLAWPLSRLFGHPDLLWAYQLIALAPLLNALRHQDLVRFQRQMRFGPMMIANAGTSLLSLLAVWPMAVWLGDYRVMLFQILLNAALNVVASHLLASRRFRVAWEPATIRRVFVFGWPLLINGALLFAVMQGDRIIVANQIGPYELGLFSAALTLAMTPSLLGAQILRTFFMPLLSRRQDDPPAFARAFVAAIQTLLCAGAALAAGLAIFGPPVFVAVYGEKYAPGVAVFLWLAVMFAMRLARAGPTTAAMAQAHTKNPMIANAARLISLPAAFAAAAGGASMETVVAISAGGELVSFVVATLLVRWKLGLARLDRLGLPYALAAAILALVAWLAAAGPGETPGAFVFDWRHGAILALLAALVFACREMRERLFKEFARRRGKDAPR